VTDQYQAILAAYESERPLYEELVSLAVPALQAAIDMSGLHTLAVTGRTKEPRSFALKACIGHNYDNPLQEIGDKAGVRVMVIYQRDIDAVIDIVQRTFKVVSVDRKLEALDFDRNGYLGTHIQATLDPAGDSTTDELAPLEFEVQVRTLAQSAWAEVSHAELYKPPADVPQALKRRIYRLVALVELIDNEVETFCDDAVRTAGYVEALYVTHLTERMARLGNSWPPDRRLTRELCAAIVPLYELDRNALQAHIDRFIDENEAGLRNVIGEGEEVAKSSANPLLAQPELPLICERLETDRVRLEASWPASVPQRWLDDLAEKWGVGSPPL
jgi:ppGpp synthetase/RelA/SpoT-type nucleotidyltranferase